MPGTTDADRTAVPAEEIVAVAATALLTESVSVAGGTGSETTGRLNVAEVSPSTSTDGCPTTGRAGAQRAGAERSHLARYMSTTGDGSTSA